MRRPCTLDTEWATDHVRSALDGPSRPRLRFLSHPHLLLSHRHPTPWPPTLARRGTGPSPAGLLLLCPSLLPPATLAPMSSMTLSPPQPSVVSPASAATPPPHGSPSPTPTTPDGATTIPRDGVTTSVPPDRAVWARGQCGGAQGLHPGPRRGRGSAAWNMATSLRGQIALCPLPPPRRLRVQVWQLRGPVALASGNGAWVTTGLCCKRFPHLHLCPSWVLPEVYLAAVFE